MQRSDYKQNNYMTKLYPKTKSFLEQTRDMYENRSYGDFVKPSLGLQNNDRIFTAIINKNLFEATFLLDFLTDFVHFHVRSLSSMFLKLSIAILSVALLCLNLSNLGSLDIQRLNSISFIDALAHYVNP